MAKRGELIPSLIITAVVRAHTVAEWLLGIPPLPTSLSNLNSLFKKKCRIVLIICAISQLKKEAATISFLASVRIISDILSSHLLFSTIYYNNPLYFLQPGKAGIKPIKSLYFGAYIFDGTYK